MEHFKEENLRTELSQLGEFGLIKHLTENIKIHHPSTIKGVGDDAAVIDYKNKKTLISTDLLIENIHFDLTYTPLKHLGYKAAVVNFSDIAAMNALPKQMLVSIAVSSRFSVEAIDELYSGLLLACEKYKVDLIGGDTTSSPGGLFISVTIMGEAETEKITYRNGAKPNELICVSGDLASAYCGLMVLEREKAVFKANPNMQPELDEYAYIIERQLKPEARTDVVQLLEQLNVTPTAMIDISDGLASEVLHLCFQSNTGCQLFEDKIPIDQSAFNTALEFNIEPTTAILNGGEDYELLFSVKQEDYEKIKNNPDITVIGHFTDVSEGMQLITRNGQAVSLTAQGWDAFLNKHKNIK